MSSASFASVVLTWWLGDVVTSVVSWQHSSRMEPTVSPVSAATRVGMCPTEQP